MYQMLAGLKAFFDINTGVGGKYVCPLSVLLREPKLDTIQLDEFLHERHGEYETETPEGVSMFQLISREYGEEAEAFVRRFM
jgi:hypothetical protein